MVASHEQSANCVVTIEEQFDLNSSYIATCIDNYNTVIVNSSYT